MGKRNMGMACGQIWTPEKPTLCIAASPTVEGKEKSGQL